MDHAHADCAKKLIAAAKKVYTNGAKISFFLFPDFDNKYSDATLQEVTAEHGIPD